MINYTCSGAILNEERTHRYKLWRRWDSSKGMILFIGLNPSRGDETYNDPTIIRCCKFAQDWGYGGIYFGNLYSFRTPLPSELIKNIETAKNADTDRHLIHMINDAKIVVAAWGRWSFIEDRSDQVLSIIPEPFCMGTNQDGSPKHPLYLSKSTTIKAYDPKGNR